MSPSEKNEGSDGKADEFARKAMRDRVAEFAIVTSVLVVERGLRLRLPQGFGSASLSLLLNLPPLPGTPHIENGGTFAVDFGDGRRDRHNIDVRLDAPQSLGSSIGSSQDYSGFE